MKQSNITIFKTSFVNNQAVCHNEMCIDDSENLHFAPQGGALAIYESDLLIKYSIFDSNCASRLGGAIHAIKSTINISTTTCVNNSAANNENDSTTYGGVLCSNQSAINFTECNLNFNRADYGGVMATVRSILVIDNDTFIDNSAKRGGGVIISYQDHVCAVRNHFMNNYSGERGGSVTAAWSSIVATTNSFINSTSYAAGVVFAGGYYKLQLEYIQPKFCKTW